MKHEGDVNAVTFSADGTKIATASGDPLRGTGDVQLWDVSTGKPLGQPRKRDSIVWAVAFSPDGRNIAAACGDNTVRIWQVPRSLPDDPPWIEAYSQVISGWKEDIDGTLHPISAAEGAVAWREIDNSPAWLEYRKVVLKESRRALHEEEAAHWEAEKNPFAAAFHLKWLLDRNPQDSELRRRLVAVRGLKPRPER